MSTSYGGWYFSSETGCSGDLIAAGNLEQVLESFHSGYLGDSAVRVSKRRAISYSEWNRGPLFGRHESNVGLRVSRRDTLYVRVTRVLDTVWRDCD
jgi:hypothetical protein